MRLNTNITPRWIEVPAAPGVRFRVRPMTGQDRLELAQQVEKRGPASAARYVYPAAAQVLAIRACLQEWEGVTDEDGKALRYTPEHLSLIADEMILLELFNAVATGSSLEASEDPAEDESGN